MTEGLEPTGPGSYMRWDGAFSSEVGSLAKVSGHIDAIGRPLVSIVSLATGDPFLATVDTGFNGALMTSAFDAPTLGVRIIDSTLRVELGDGRSVVLRSGRLKLRWLGIERDVDVYLSDEPSRGSEGRPVALIGSRLLAPHLLLVDYGAQTVEIETQGD